MLLLTWLLVAMTALAAPVDRQRVAEGFRALDGRYDSPTLRIWLDRPGDDVRGHFEGRINLPWWSAANPVETMLDFMTATGRNDFDVRLADAWTAGRSDVAALNGLGVERPIAASLGECGLPPVTGIG